MKKPRVVSDWRRAWKWYSVNIPTVNAAMLATWTALPEKFQSAIPIHWLLWMAVVLLIAGVVGRLIDQKPKE